MREVSKVGAFFDMDGTILAINSGVNYLKLVYRKGIIGPRQLARGLLWVLQYKLGVLDADKVFGLAIKTAAGDSEQEMIERCRAWFEEEIQGTILPKARQTIEEHRAQGHIIALLTSATNYAADPVCEALQIPHVLCTRLEVEANRFTGKVKKPLCFGPGKVLVAEAFAQEHQIDLSESFFYTDSVSDLAMLERVGNPRIVNPDLRLRWVATKRGWPRADFGHPG
jgi:HAD superfamily hydrolase (TIGR01490 family)